MNPDYLDILHQALTGETGKKSSNWALNNPDLLKIFEDAVEVGKKKSATKIQVLSKRQGDFLELLIDGEFEWMTEFQINTCKRVLSDRRYNMNDKSVLQDLRDMYIKKEKHVQV